MKTKDGLELPQIHSPIRGAATEAELAAEHDDIEKLNKIVVRAFLAIANATRLSDKDVLHAVEDHHVDMLKDVLKDGIRVHGLKEGIQEAIKEISLATGLDTAQISDTFSANKDTDLKGIVNQLYKSGQVNAGF